MNPIKLIKLITPLVGLFKGRAGNDSPLTRNWRPITMGVLVLLVVVSFFTSYQLSDELLTAITVLVTAYIGGRSIEKATKEVAKVVKKHEKNKRKESEDGNQE